MLMTDLQAFKQNIMAKFLGINAPFEGLSALYSMKQQPGEKTDQWAQRVRMGMLYVTRKQMLEMNQTKDFLTHRNYADKETMPPRIDFFGYYDYLTLEYLENTNMFFNGNWPSPWANMVTEPYPLLTHPNQKIRPACEGGKFLLDLNGMANGFDGRRTVEGDMDPDRVCPGYTGDARPTGRLYTRLQVTGGVPGIAEIPFAAATGTRTTATAEVAHVCGVPASRTLVSWYQGTMNENSEEEKKRFIGSNNAVDKGLPVATTNLTGEVGNRPYTERVFRFGSETPLNDSMKPLEPDPMETWHAAHNRAANPPEKPRSELDPNNIPSDHIWKEPAIGSGRGLLRLIKRAMAAGAMIEIYRSMMLSVIQIFIKNSRADIYQELMSNMDQIKSLEDAINIANRYEAGRNKPTLSMSAVDIGVGVPYCISADLKEEESGVDAIQDLRAQLADMKVQLDKTSNLEDQNVESVADNRNRFQPSAATTASTNWRGSSSNRSGRGMPFSQFPSTKLGVPGSNTPNSNPGQNNDSAQDRCYRCYRFGHFARDCKYPPHDGYVDRIRGTGSGGGFRGGRSSRVRVRMQRPRVNAMGVHEMMTEEVWLDETTNQISEDQSEYENTQNNDDIGAVSGICVSYEDTDLAAI